MGTGRIARPVAEAGARVVGFDLSPQMLAEAAHADGLHRLRADMHAFPFAGGMFDAVLAVHVLHLATDWEQVLAEAARVLRPGGAFIVGSDWVAPDGVIGALRAEMRRCVMELAPGMKPPSAGKSREAALQELGGTETQEVIAARWEEKLSPAARLRTIEERLDSESWILPDDVFEAVVPKLVSFAEARWGDIEKQQVVERRFVLSITRGAWDSSIF